jgi:hypothetical protein
VTGRTISLTTIGSASVHIQVTPAALPEAEGGVTIWIHHWPGTRLSEKVAYTLTVGEAKELVAELARALSPWLFEETAS